MKARITDRDSASRESGACDGKLRPRTPDLLLQGCHDRRRRDRAFWQGQQVLFVRFARVLHEIDEPARQFGNPAALVLPDRFAWDQRGADTNSRCASADELRRRPLRDATSRHQRNLRKGSRECLNIPVPANLGTREHFHEIGTGLPRRDDFCWRQRTWIARTQAVDVIKDDPTDNRILECAAEAKSDYVVTGDKAMLRVGNCGDIPIVSVADFLEMFSHQQKGRNR
jgi:hypothetical protein